MKILITGGAGFIGSNAANILADKGYQIIAFDNLSLGKKENLDKGIKFIEGNVEKPRDLEKLNKNIDFIIHLAAASSAPMFESDLVGSYHNNIIGFLNILEFASKRKIKKVLFASTSSIYGDNPTPLKEEQDVSPPNFYSVTKHTMEETARVYSQLFNLEIIGFRFMSVYGLHEEHKGRFANLVSQFIWSMNKNQPPVLYGNGTQERDFTNVNDVVAVFEALIKTPKKYGYAVFNIGTGKSYSLVELVKIINKTMGKKIKPKFIVNPLKWTAKEQLADLTKINQELGYQPKISLEEGIGEIVNHLKRRK